MREFDVDVTCNTKKWTFVGVTISEEYKFMYMLDQPWI